MDRQRVLGLLPPALIALVGAQALGWATDAGAKAALKTWRKTLGYHMDVTSHEVQLAKRSAVKVDWRWPGNQDAPPTPWYQNCSGTKIYVPGSTRRYVLTAGHCFSTLTLSSNGLFRDFNDPSATAESFPFPGVRYAVSAAVTRTKSPSAGVIRNSIGTDLADMALLWPTLPPPSGDLPTEAAGLAFHNIVARSAGRFFTTQRKPVVGEQVAFYATPDPIPETYPKRLVIGRYLGRFRMPGAEPPPPGVLSEPYGSPPYPWERVDCVVFGPGLMEGGESGGSGLAADGRSFGPLSFKLPADYADTVAATRGIRISPRDTGGCFEVLKPEFAQQLLAGLGVQHQYVAAP